MSGEEVAPPPTGGGINPPEEMLKWARGNLRKTHIHVTTPAGTAHIERIGEGGEIEVANERSSDKSPFVVDKEEDYSYGRLKSWLLLGAQDISKDKEFLTKLGVTHIINLATFVKNSFPQDFKYLQIDVMDMPHENIKQHFLPMIQFIESAREAGGVCYVHCNAGVSRAPTTCIAYLMYTESVCRDNCLKYVKEKRWIYPNPGFMGQLLDFERELHVTNMEKMCSYS